MAKRGFQMRRPWRYLFSVRPGNFLRYMLMRAARRGSEMFLICRVAECLVKILSRSAGSSCQGVAK